MVTINTSNGIFKDGRQVKISQLDTKHVYVQGKKLPSPIGPMATVDECSRLIDACKAFTWTNPESAKLLAGWFVVANCAGAIPIRPHIWLTGQKGTGKSTILQKLVPALLPAYYSYQGSTTEAAIRQGHQYSCFPIIFDEFEPAERDDDTSRDKVLELFRQAWSNSDGAIARGSSGGQAVQYYVVTCAMLASITVSLKNEADKSRFSVLELGPHDPKKTGAEFKRLTDQVDAVLGIKIWRRLANMLPTLRANYGRIRELLIERGETSRYSEHNAMLAAGYHLLLSDGLLTESEAEDIRKKRLFPHGEEETPEWREILTLILTAPMRHHGSVNTTIGMCIAENANLDVLKRNGIRLEEKIVYVSNNHSSLKDIMRRTKWRSGWADALARIPGAIKEQKAVRFGDHPAKCVSIPIAYFIEMIE